jgi:hypothetical protein
MRNHSIINVIFECNLNILMRERYYFPVLVGLLLLLNPSCSPLRKLEEKGPEKEYKTRYVVVVVIDGPRYTETFGDTSCQYIPKLGKELVKEGTLFTQFMNNGKTFTTPGHTAITTGVYQSITNGGKQLPDNPSMFQYYLKEKAIDKSKVWLISSKGKLEVLANTKRKNKKWWNVYMPSSYCGPKGNSSDYEGDIKTFAKVEEVFRTYSPNLTLINLLAVDVYGHANNWGAYLESLKKCDDYTDRIWKLIQSNPLMKDQTALFVTNDHGRHLDGVKDGFVSHGDHCEGCKHISLLAMGPDFKQNAVINTPAEMIDISQTIAELLHFSMPTSRGRVLTEMFR